MGQGFRLEIHASQIFVPLTFASGYLFSVALGDASASGQGHEAIKDRIEAAVAVWYAAKKRI